MDCVPCFLSFRSLSDDMFKRGLDKLLWGYPALVDEIIHSPYALSRGHHLEEREQRLTGDSQEASDGRKTRDAETAASCPCHALSVDDSSEFLSSPVILSESVSRGEEVSTDAENINTRGTALMREGAESCETE